MRRMASGKGVESGLRRALPKRIMSEALERRAPAPARALKVQLVPGLEPSKGGARRF